MQQLNIPDWKADLGSVTDLAKFFSISRAAIPGLMKEMGVPKRGRGYPWIRIWVALGIDLATVRDPAVLRTPLLELQKVAVMLGESPKTTRRRSEGKHRDRSFPAHLNLGPRKRLFFEGEIRAWLLGEPVPFKRRQSKLVFIPAAERKNRAQDEPEPTSTQRKTPRGSAASLFLAPPPSN
ncbi:hypothetical protein [Phycobacter azelaicus]|uniref:hypothetical protein n=1 Tax=Phycobacter azelaicus TaxID=2668075 RepID=UPI001866F7A3|nr:hypothetical protein [Phycobacter azelaicus]MBE1297155.1 hypothetical protein [Paracoccaceae bacterium]